MNYHFEAPALALGLGVAGLGLIVTAFALRRKGRVSVFLPCLVLGVLAFAAGGIFLLMANVDVVTKTSYGEGDDHS